MLKKWIFIVLLVSIPFQGFAQEVAEMAVKRIVRQILKDVPSAELSLIERESGDAFSREWRRMTNAALHRYIDKQGGKAIDEAVYNAVKKAIGSPQATRQMIEAHPEIFSDLMRAAEATQTRFESATSVIFRFDLEDELIAPTLSTSSLKPVGVQASETSSAFLEKYFIQEVIAQEARVAQADKAVLDMLFPNFSVSQKVFKHHPKEFFALLSTQEEFSVVQSLRSPNSAAEFFYELKSKTRPDMTIKIFSMSYDGGSNQAVNLIRIEIQHDVVVETQKVVVKHTLLYTNDSLEKWVSEFNGQVQLESLFH